MVTIHVLYEGGLHTRVTHGPSKSELATDAPVDNQGRGESFSPTDLVATALGSCMATTMGIAAKKNGWDMDGARVTVEKHMVADPLRRVGKLAVRIEMPKALGAKERGVLEKAAHTCPVRVSLDPRIEVPVDFQWGDSR